MIKRQLISTPGRRDAGFHDGLLSFDWRSAMDGQLQGTGAGRFLFIDVSAMRAKQLRAGARPRITTEALVPHKLEWVAMEEVRRGLVSYELPSQMGESDAAVP
jgi:DNA-directed RNA polymerase subunit K/omega